MTIRRSFSGREVERSVYRSQWSLWHLERTQKCTKINQDFSWKFYEFNNQFYIYTSKPFKGPCSPFPSLGWVFLNWSKQVFMVVSSKLLDFLQQVLGFVPFGGPFEQTLLWARISCTNMLKVLFEFQRLHNFMFTTKYPQQITSKMIFRIILASSVKVHFEVWS